MITEKNDLQINRSDFLLNDQFKQAKKYVESLVNNAKNTHFKEKFNSCRGNSGATWGVVKEMIPGLKGESKMNFENPLQKAEEFNEYFSTIGEIAFKKSQ